MCRIEALSGGGCLCNDKLEAQARYAAARERTLPIYKGAASCQMLPAARGGDPSGGLWWWLADNRLSAARVYIRLAAKVDVIPAMANVPDRG